MTNIKYPTPQEALAYAENTGRNNMPGVDLPPGWYIRANEFRTIEIELYYGVHLMALSYSDHRVRIRRREDVQCKDFNDALNTIVSYAWENE